MNWLVVVVVLILFSSAKHGFHRGFARELFALVATLLSLVLVTTMTPVVSDFLIEKTNITTHVAAACEDYIEKQTGKRLEEQKKTDTKKEKKKNKNSKKNNSNKKKPTEAKVEEQEQLAEKMDALATVLANGTKEVLKENSEFQQLATTMTRKVVNGISFLLVYCLIRSILSALESSMNVFNRVPIVKEANQALGLFLGLAKGLLSVWIIFCLADFMSMSALGANIITCVEENVFLTQLYDYNLVSMVIDKVI